MAPKKDYEDAPLIGSGRVGLAVMRVQPPHRGHMSLINQMRSDCDVAIVAIGTTQLSRVMRNPFTFEQRVSMLRGVFGNTIKPIPLVDIDSSLNTDDWVDYVLDKIKKLNLPEPTDYYTGSSSDAKWYVNRFAKLSDPMTQIGMARVYSSPETGKRLHVQDRYVSELPPAEEIRSLIERRDDDWKTYVPARLIDYIEWNYPPELRVAMTGDALPIPQDTPVGTRFCLVENSGQRLFSLEEDGEWREIS